MRVPVLDSCHPGGGPNERTADALRRDEVDLARLGERERFDRFCHRLDEWELEQDPPRWRAGFAGAKEGSLVEFTRTARVTHGAKGFGRT